VAVHPQNVLVNQKATFKFGINRICSFKHIIKFCLKFLFKILVLELSTARHNLSLLTPLKDTRTVLWPAENLNAATTHQRSHHNFLL